MLIRALPEPDLQLGEFTLRLLESREWIRRRVETIKFLDHRTLERRVTLDVSMTQVAALEGTHEQLPLGSKALPDENVRPLPLTLIQKGLLSDFNIRDCSGSSLPIATRPEDSYLAWCALAAQIKQSGLVVPVTGAVANHLQAIIENFPDPADRPGDPELESWAPHTGWRNVADEEQWKAIRDDVHCNRILRDFTFNFILVAALPRATGPHIVKISYQEGFDIGGFGWGQKVIFVDAPAVGWTRSCHMQFEDPEGLQVLDVALVRIGSDLDRPAQVPKQTEYYHAKVSETRSQVYAGPVERANYLAILYMRLRIPGFLRAAWLSSLFTLMVLVAAVVFRGTIAKQNGSADAIAALLLVIPSTLTAYLVRPGEHGLLARALLSTRLAMVATALMTYLAASIVALGYGTEWMARIIGPGVAIALIPAVLLSGIILQTWRDARQQSESIGLTQRDEIDLFQVS